VPFFTIIIPTYNRRKLLEEAIDSVLNQTFKDFEIIVIDDNSTDDTWNYLCTLEQKNIIAVKNDLNRHVSYSRNRAVSLSKGEWIVFLDDDDLMMEKKLQVVYDVITKFPKINFIHHLAMIELTNTKSRVSSNESSKDYFDSLLVSNIIGGPNNVAIKKTLFQKSGGFDESLKFAEEYELWIRLSLSDDFHPFFIEKPLAIIKNREQNSLNFDLQTYQNARKSISSRYAKEIERLPFWSRRKREENYLKGYAFRAIYSSRIKASIYFFKAFMCRFNPVMFGASVVALFFPAMIKRRYR
jgi:glycosyltransferase involved in cell wall biosynthesis